MAAPYGATRRAAARRGARSVQRRKHRSHRRRTPGGAPLPVHARDHSRAPQGREDRARYRALPRAGRSTTGSPTRRQRRANRGSSSWAWSSPTSPCRSSSSISPMTYASRSGTRATVSTMRRSRAATPSATSPNSAGSVRSTWPPRPPIALYEAAPAGLADELMHLAHQDPAEVVRYKRAGWWGETTVGDLRRPVGARAAGLPRPSSPGTTGCPGPSTTRARPDSAERWSPPGCRVMRVWRCCSPTASPSTSRSSPPSAPGLTVVGIGHRAGDAELRHLLTPTGADAIVVLGRRRGSRAGYRPRSPGSSSTRDGRCDGRRRRASTNATLAARRLGADDLFLVNSTSGTTGLPKCVMHNQNRWMYFHQLAAAAGRFTRDDVFFSALPAPFGFGIWTAHVTPAVLGCTDRRARTLRCRRGLARDRARAGHACSRA